MPSTTMVPPWTAVFTKVRNEPVVANGLQANQFSIGDCYAVDCISDLDQTYKQRMDKARAGPGTGPL